jgi:hypothetical protein
MCKEPDDTSGGRFAAAPGGGVPCRTPTEEVAGSCPREEAVNPGCQAPVVVSLIAGCPIPRSDVTFGG